MSAAGTSRCGGRARPYLPLIMGLALLAGTFGAARGHSPSVAGPVRQVPATAVAAQPAPAGASVAGEAASGAAPVLTRETDTQVVAAPQAPAAPDLVGYPSAVGPAQWPARSGSSGTGQPVAGPPVAMRPAPARGAAAGRAPPRSA